MIDTNRARGATMPLRKNDHALSWHAVWELMSVPMDGQWEDRGGKRLENKSTQVEAFWLN